MSLVLSGTDGLSDVDGTAAAPAIRGTDANTGIFFPAADTIGFAEGGTEVMRIDSSGRVGIGTSSPATKLVLAGDNTGLAENNTLRFWDTDTATEANQQIGKIEFYSSDASSPGAGVKAYIGAFATDTTPEAYLAFATAEAAGATEQARLTAAGLLQFNSGYGSVATAYGCRAWVNFNGSGTVAIRDDGNVSSITDNGTGDYTVNFTTAMPDVNYAMLGTGRRPVSTADAIVCYNRTTSPTTAAVRIATTNGAGTNEDFDIVAVAIFR